MAVVGSGPREVAPDVVHEGLIVQVELGHGAVGGRPRTVRTQEGRDERQDGVLVEAQDHGDHGAGVGQLTPGELQVPFQPALLVEFPQVFLRVLIGGPADGAERPFGRDGDGVVRRRGALLVVDGLAGGGVHVGHDAPSCR